MSDTYIALRDEIRKILRSRANKKGEIKKQEVYEVFRGIRTSSEIGDGETAPKHRADIFVIGCCVIFEDAIRFNFVGYELIDVESAISVIDDIRIAD